MDTTNSMILKQELKAAEKLLRFIYLIRCRNICGICNLQLTTKTNLNEHMEVHTGTSYTCDCCKVICDTWTGYQEHIRSIHRLMVFCPYCYKAHTNYWRLSLHWRIHGKKIYLLFVDCSTQFFWSNIMYNESVFAYRAVRVRDMLLHVQNTITFEGSSHRAALWDTIRFTVSFGSRTKRRIKSQGINSTKGAFILISFYIKNDQYH